MICYEHTSGCQHASLNFSFTCRNHTYMNAKPYPIEIEPVDISAYKVGNTGPYVTTFDSGTPGPHVMVMALTHGNELCGAITLVTCCADIRPIQES